MSKISTWDSGWFKYRREVKMSKRVNLTLQDSQYDFWLQKAQEKDMSIHDFIKHAVKVYLTMIEKVQKERKRDK